VKSDVGLQRPASIYSMVFKLLLGTTMTDAEEQVSDSRSIMPAWTENT
jgi:hypothetical protein